MRRVVMCALGALALAVTLVPTTLAYAQPAATVSLLHGLPGVVADVSVGGQVVVPNFQPGQIQDLSAFAGQTLRNVEVRPAGSQSVLIGPISGLAVPATGNITVVAHLRADGTPALTTFDNDMRPVPAGQGRLTIRHVAAAPAVDVIVGPARPFTNLANGAQATAVLNAGPITQISVAPVGGAPAVALPNLELRAGENLVVYAAGDLAKGTLVVYTQTLGGLGGTPTRVNTGEGPVSAPAGPSPLPSPPVTAAVLAATVVVALVARARLARAERA